MTSATVPVGLRGSRLALAGLILAVSMTTIDQTIVALAAPTIETDLRLDHGAVQWAVNVYLIATAACFLLGGRLADVLGHKRMVLIGVVGFGATSLLCSLAPDGAGAAAWLIGARALQGVAGAVMFPAAIGIVVQGFPRASRAGAMASFFAVSGAMTALGPIAGGYLSEWNWRAIFWVNVPIAVIAAVIIAIAAPAAKPVRERIDFAGALVIAAGIALLVFGLQQAGTWGWASPAVVGAVLAGVALLVLFVLLERRVEVPLVRLAVFRERGFTIATIATLVASFAFLSSFFFLSVYGQVAERLTAQSTGLLFLDFFVGFVIASRIGARRFDRLGARSVLIIAGIIGAAGFAWLAVAVTSIPAHPGDVFTPLTLPILVAGAGIGFMLSAASTDAVNRAIGASYGEVSAISQTMRNLGGALGLAVLTTLVTERLTSALTSSFAALGAPASAVAAAVGRISGTSAASGSLDRLPAAVREQFVHAVAQGYADSVAWAFAAMAGAMLVITALGLLYPRGEVSAVAEPVAAATV